MDENPYQSPVLEDTPRIVREQSVDLRSIALYQKLVLVCLVVCLLVAATVNFIERAIFGSSDPFAYVLVVVVALVGLGAGLIGIAFLVLLAVKLHGLSRGFLLGVLAIPVPPIGLVVWWIVDRKATRVLRENEVRVGWFGVRLSELPRPNEETSAG